jgi:PAS domain S-box-containing protein
MSPLTDRFVASDRRTGEASVLPLDDKQLSTLLAGFANPVYIEDLQSRRIVYWNAGAATLFGYAVKDREAAEIRLEADDEEFSAKALPDIEKNGIWRGTRRYRRADGSVVSCRTTVSRLRGEAGDCAVVVIHDNGEESPGPRVAEAATRFSVPTESIPAPGERKAGEHLVGYYLRNIGNCAVFTTDTRGNIGEWNREASKLLGYERAEAVGKHVSLICAEDSARALQKTFQEAREQGTSRYYQWMTRKDGRRIYARVVAFALWDDTQVQGFLFLLRDDSRAPNLKQVLREKEQMAAIGTAASILAHEIGNPLNGISATVQLLEHCLSRPILPSAQSMLSSVDDLKSEVKRLTALLNEFKNIAWPQKLALGPVDLKRLIHQLTGDIEKRSSRQNVEVAVDCQDGMPLLNGNDDKLKQALMHVLDNALDAMPHGGRLEIKAYRYEDTICIDIIDTGVGIPKNLKVFDLFSSTKPDGLGLGLFLVQQIVLAHDGAITYSSTPGQGTTFHVTFSLNPSPDPLGLDFIDNI